MQIIADVTGRPVFTIAQDVEAAMGAALAGGATASASPPRTTCAAAGSPRAAGDAPRARERRYDTLFETYKSLYPALRATMHDLHDQSQSARAASVRDASNLHERSVQ